MSTLKLGALCWNQCTDWPSFLEAGMRADELGFDSLWTWIDLYPIVGSPDGPILEGYMAMAALAARTERATVGLMVGANTMRNPALVAKMITTLDHISGGRAVLGIGAAWFEAEHTDFGIEFGSGPGERLRWLGEALPIMRGMLDGSRPSAPEGGRYAVREARNVPRAHPGAPAHPRRWQRTKGDAASRGALRRCRTIAGTPAQVAEAEARLREHCTAIGRDEHSIERTVSLGVVVIRNSEAEARRVGEQQFAHNGGAQPRPDQQVGTVDQVVEQCAPYIALGYHHLTFRFPAPFDDESMTRLATEVRPRLEALLGA